MAVVHAVLGTLIAHWILARCRSWNAVRFERRFREEMQEKFESSGNVHVFPSGKRLRNLFEDEIH